MRIVLLTSDQRRHRYAAWSLAQDVDLTGIVSEPKPSTVAAPQPQDASAEAEIVRRHFRERDEAEARLLGEPAFPAAERLEVPAGGINGEAVFRWVSELRPDLLVLYGTRIVTDPLLAAWPGRIVNLHLGLSPYYRGSGTNFWPLARRQPECVGATIHLAVRRVDAGPVLAQVRPDAQESDRCHDLGTRTLMRGVAALPRALRLYLAGELEPAAQDLSRGQVFRSRDFHAGAVREMWGHFETGMMAEYLDQAERRHAAYPIVAAPAA